MVMIFMHLYLLDIQERLSYVEWDLYHLYWTAFKFIFLRVHLSSIVSLCSALVLIQCRSAFAGHILFPASLPIDLDNRPIECRYGNAILSKSYPPVILQVEITILSVSLTLSYALLLPFICSLWHFVLYGLWHFVLWVIEIYQLPTPSKAQRKGKDKKKRKKKEQDYLYSCFLS